MQKPNLLQTKAIPNFKEEARAYARKNLKPENAPGFELYADNMLCLLHTQEGHIKANPKCNHCFGLGLVRAILNPGKPTKGQKTEIRPCKCTYSQYLDAKPKDEVILPAGEYGKPLEPPAEVQKSKANPVPKKSTKRGSSGPKKEPAKSPRVRKNKSSISGEGQN